MHEHAPRLARLATAWCDDPSDAADLVQDTFERVMRRGGIPPHIQSPCGYLVTTLKNLIRDRRRARARRPILEPLHDHAAASADELPAWAAFGLEDIHGALSDLAPVYRETFILHALEHRNYDELATHFAIHPITVGTRLTRARKLLRAALQKRTANVLV